MLVWEALLLLGFRDLLHLPLRTLRAPLAPRVTGTKFGVHGLKKKVNSLCSKPLTLSEAALFAGLEAVQGPNWAAILQLYGPGGSISEALKDRSQVQLKDKARNLKLFFLKGGHEVPRVLERVTGRLKGEGHSSDDTPTRKVKKRRTEADGETFDISSSQPTQQSFTAAEWSQTAQGQEQNYGMVEQNVDPGLQMPQGS